VKGLSNHAQNPKRKQEFRGIITPGFVSKSGFEPHNFLKISANLAKFRFEPVL